LKKDNFLLLEPVCYHTEKNDFPLNQSFPVKLSTVLLINPVMVFIFLRYPGSLQL
jgi:hypothetical protein